MKIASWNVNSIKVRQQHVHEWLEAHQPDFLFLQEIKCETDQFPYDYFKDMGYHIYVKGQKANHGVALFSKSSCHHVSFTLPSDRDDLQARYIEVIYDNLVMIGVYAPNGNPIGTEKYSYKLAWYDRLIAHIKGLMKRYERLYIIGDFNIIPEARDCYDPVEWQEDALFTKAVRDKFFTLKHLGIEDAYRVLYPDTTQIYTFWDYQNGAWQKNLGLRIDHMLCSAACVDRLEAFEIFQAERAKSRPSDHVPILVTMET